MLRLVIPLLAVSLLGGCSRDDGEADIPAACEGPPGVLADALREAPAPVSLDGVRVSDCLAKDSSVGDVLVVGGAMLGAAQELADESDAAALGYLVGAMRRGSEQSQGIYAEAVRRIEQEARPLRGERAFNAGVRAGRTSG